MSELGYLSWMARETPSDWCNDSALLPLVHRALENGAVGCTTNPPLTYQALSDPSEEYRAVLASVPASVTGDARSEALTSGVVRTIAAILRPIWEATEGALGYVRAQVQPTLYRDVDAMFEMGKRYASIAPNVMVKIPGSTAGVRVLEELAAIGIPTTPTICVSVPQMVAVAEAHERGIARARKAGLPVPASTGAIVFGRTRDYLAALNEERGIGLPVSDLSLVAIAVAKKCHAIYRKRGYAQVVMPAAFRSAEQVAALAGGNLCMTIRPDYQSTLDDAEKAGQVQRRSAIDDEVDPAVLDRVARTIPEFAEAYADPATESTALAVEAFDGYRGLLMTIDSFHQSGWEPLKSVGLG